MASEEPDDESFRRSVTRRDDRKAPDAATVRTGTSYDNAVIRRRDKPLAAVGGGWSSLGSARSLGKAAP